MKRISWGFLFFILTLMFVVGAQAAKFKGHEKGADIKTEEIREPLRRFEETPKEFLLVVKHRAAMFSFPKKTSYESEVRDYLQSAVKSKKPIVLQIDPKTAKIHTIGEK